MIKSKKVVVYYTQTYFLDATLETIQSIKNDVELHILIEIAPESMNSTILNVNRLERFNSIEIPEKVLGFVKWLQLRPYFEGVASVHFLIHKYKKSFCFNTIKVALQAGKFIKSLHPDIIHFDTISQRSIGLYPYIIGKNIILTIHDPIPHSGEGTWKQLFIKKIFYPIAKGFFFYSKFACNQFHNIYATKHAPLNLLKLQSYSIIQQYVTEELDTTIDPFVLFFGRISKYKGIDLLLDAIPIVLKSFPNQKFVIAGKGDGYEIDTVFMNKYRDNIIFLNKYFKIEDLANCVSSSKFIVCPYRDATQSGVLMTAMSLGKTVVATDVGAFPEYIIDNFNGLLVKPDTFEIANAIIKALHNNYYKKLEEKVISCYDKEICHQNRHSLLNTYNSMPINQQTKNIAQNIIINEGLY